jgi:hypothetical protein
MTHGWFEQVNQPRAYCQNRWALIPVFECAGDTFLLLRILVLALIMMNPSITPFARNLPILKSKQNGLVALNIHFCPASIF